MMTPLGADALRASFIGNKGVGKGSMLKFVTPGFLPYLNINRRKVGIALGLERYFGDN